MAKRLKINKSIIHKIGSNAWGAFRLAKDVWNDDTATEDAKAQFQREMIFPIGEPNTAYAKYFIGNSYLAQISKDQIPFANVTFEPGCRNNWHVHTAEKGGGQMLVGVANVKHWHGAAKDSWFAHLAFSVPGEETDNVWLEPVTDEQYNKLP